MYTFAIFMSMAILCSASVKGPCPKRDPITNFDLNAYATGAWYEIARSNDDWENKADCVTAKAMRTPHGVLMEVTEIVDHKLIITDGIAFQVEDTNIGKMNYIIQGYELNVTILAVDYDKYSIEYNCAYNETDDSHTESIWVISRTKSIDKETMEEIEKFIVSVGLTDAQLFWDHYFDETCKYKTLQIERTVSDRLFKRIN